MTDAASAQEPVVALFDEQAKIRPSGTNTLDTLEKNLLWHRLKRCPVAAHMLR